MFKKKEDLTERSKSLLKNKEVRQLKQTVASNFGIEADDLFPGKGNVSVAKLVDKSLIYSVSDLPVIFDVFIFFCNKCR